MQQSNVIVGGFTPDAVTAVNDFVAAGRTAMEKAVIAGQALIAEKEKLPHGQWMPWCEANLPISVEWASKLMKLAKGVELLEANLKSTSNFSSVDEALKEIRKLKNPDKGEEETPKQIERTETMGKLTVLSEPSATLRAAAVAYLDGKGTQDEIAIKFGEPRQQVRAAIQYENGYRAGQNTPVITADDLSVTAAAKLESAIKAHKKKLDTEFKIAVADRATEALKERRLPAMMQKADRVINMMQNRKSLLSSKEYKLLKMCLHPDSNMSMDKKSEALRLLDKIEIVVTDKAMEKNKSEALNAVDIIKEMMS